MSVQGAKRKRVSPKTTNLSPEEMKKRLAAAKRFKQNVDEGAATLDARTAKPGTNVMAIILKKFPTRSVKTKKGGKVPSTGFVALVGAFTVDENVEDELDPETGIVTIPATTDQDADITEPVQLHPHTVYSFSMFRKLTNVHQGSVVKLYALGARFWTPTDPPGPRMIFYGAGSIQTMVQGNDFAFVSNILHAMPNLLTRWMDEPERPDKTELSQLDEERKESMDRKRSGGGNSRQQVDESGKKKKKGRRGGLENFFIHVGDLPEEEMSLEMTKANGFFSNTLFTTSPESWFYRSQEVDQDLGRNAPPLGKSPQDVIKMAVRLTVCQWKEALGGFDNRVEFTARATLFRRMLGVFGVQTPRCWDILIHHLTTLRFLTFMNEDRLETAKMSYNDPEQRDPLDKSLGAHCFVMFVQSIWFDAVAAYTRVGIPVTLQYIAGKLIQRYDPTEDVRSLIHVPANKIDSADLSKNLTCLNEFCGDLMRIDETTERYVAVTNYAAEPKYQREVEEIIKNLTPQEGTRFLEMTESTSHTALDKLVSDFGREHGVVRLEGRLRRVSMRDAGLRSVFFAIPKESESDKKKRLKHRAEFLGQELSTNGIGEEEEEEEEGGQASSSTGAAAAEDSMQVNDDPEATQAPEEDEEEEHPWQSLDDTGAGDSDDEDELMLAAVEQVEQQQRRDDAPPPPLPSASMPALEGEDDAVSRLLQDMGDEEEEDREVVRHTRRRRPSKPRRPPSSEPDRQRHRRSRKRLARHQ